jgi:hypothetical protein
MPITLLHVGDTVRVIVVDRTAIMLAALAFSAACAWIWRDELRVPLAPVTHRRPRRRLAAVAVSALFLAAMLPTIVPYDHILAGGHGDTHASVHAAHCHDSTPGDCADAPVASGPGQFIAGDPMLILPVMLSVLLVLSLPLLRGISRAPDPRPPQSQLAV